MPASPAAFRQSTVRLHKAFSLSASGAAIATILFSATAAHAVPRTWSAAASGDFNDGVNWNPTFEGIGGWTADIAIVNSGVDNVPAHSTGAVTITELWVGNAESNIGKLAINGGSITTTENTTIGRQGAAQGTATITNGGTLTTRQFRIGGGSAAAVGSLTVSGVGSTLVTGTGAAGSAVVNVGASGTGTLTLENGAAWNPIGSNPCIGGDNFAPGTTSATNLGGNGTLNIRSGASLNITNLNLAVGRNGNGNGTVNVTDGGKLILTRTAGTPFLNLANRNGNSTVPDGANYPVANVSLSGATSAINVPFILVGYGSATLNLNGGTLTAERISKDTGVTAGSATIHFNGTRIKATVDNANYFSGFDTTNLTLDVAAGGLHFDTDTFNVTINQVLPGTGGLTKSGSGSLTLTEQNTYAGDTSVTGGRLVLTTFSAIDILPDTTSLRLSNGAVIMTDIDTETVNAFYINGQPQLAGTWGPLESGAQYESEFITGEGLLQVLTTGVTPPASPFADWTTTKGLTGNDALPLADPDHDGYGNLLEFILGGEPNPATAGANTNALAPTVTKGSGNHVFSFRRTALSATEPGLAVVYQYGSDLTGWTPAVHGEDGVTIVPEPNGYGGGIDRINVTIPDALADDGKVFVRMRAVLSAN